MGEQQSRAADGEEAALADTGLAAGDANAGMTTVEVPPGIGEPVVGEAARNQATGAHQDAYSAGDILSRLIAALAKCPDYTMPLSEILASLPPDLRQYASDKQAVFAWLRGLGLFEVTDDVPGQEQVTLVVGKIPAPPVEHPGGRLDRLHAAGPQEAAYAAALDEAQVEVCPSSPTSADVRGMLSSLSPQVMGTGEYPCRDEDEYLNPSTVQLRGLPFRATIAEIKGFLDKHSANLTNDETPIRLLLNRDGRPSGFARVQFVSPEAAKACRDELHRKPMGDRYVEVLQCSDRTGKMKHRRSVEVTQLDLVNYGPIDPNTDYQERERVLQECRNHMRAPGNNQLLLSMLGIALSAPARAYLRRLNLGLKHFLARLPNEFRVEGPKGCERVSWCGQGSSFEHLAYAAPEAWPPGREPGTPKLGMLSPTAGTAGAHHGAHGVATPSDWGTPGMSGESSLQGLGSSAGMDGSCWNWHQWAGMPPSWGMTPSWPLADGAGVECAGGGGKGSRGDATLRSDASKGKRGSRGEAAPARSHVHLHPQTHPFASRSNDSTTAEGSTEPGDSEASPAPVAALRLRGLPFSVTIQDVLAFFSQNSVADRIADCKQAAQLLPKANGRPSGQAVVQMRSSRDAEEARNALDKQFIGGRWIEVFVYGAEGDCVEGSAIGTPARNTPGQSDPAEEWMRSSPWAGHNYPTWTFGPSCPPITAGQAGSLGGMSGLSPDGDLQASGKEDLDHIFRNMYRPKYEVAGADEAAHVAPPYGGAGSHVKAPHALAPFSVDQSSRPTVQV